MTTTLVFMAADCDLASHPDVFSGSSFVPHAGTRDEPLRTSAWEDNSHPTVIGIFSPVIAVSSATLERRS